MQKKAQNMYCKRQKINIESNQIHFYNESFGVVKKMPIYYVHLKNKNCGYSPLHACVNVTIFMGFWYKWRHNSQTIIFLL